MRGRRGGHEGGERYGCNTLPGKQIATRNAPAAALPLPRESLPERARRTAEVCGGCGRALAPGEPVWRVVLGEPRGGFRWSRTWTIVCASCRPPRRWDTTNEECAHCRRGVGTTRSLDARFRRPRTFCTECCRVRWFQAQAKAARLAPRQKTCAACGQAFTATRRDARTCSPACRQKAYRERPAGGRPA